jgi:hypothetical protein
MVYFNAAIQDWWGSASFGARRFDGTLPLFVIGTAAFLEHAAAFTRRHATVTVVAGLGLLAALNIGLLAAAQGGTVRIGETLPFDRVWAAEGRELHVWFGNPFSFPANLLFALRNGVSPGDYDMLRTNRFLSDPLKPYGRIDIGTDDDWAVRGSWYAPEKEGAITYRWAADGAEVRIPLDHPTGLRLQISLHAFAFPRAPAQMLTMRVNQTTCAPVAVSADWQTAECTLDASAWRAGVNRLVLGFSRTNRPVDVNVRDDRRALSAAVDFVRVSER